MGDNLWCEPQPEHVETRAKFVVHCSSMYLHGEGWIKPREFGQSKDITVIEIDRTTLFETSMHGVEIEDLRDEDLTFWVKAGLVVPVDDYALVYVLDGEYEVLA